MNHFTLSHVCDVRVRVNYGARDFAKLQHQFPGYLNPLYRNIFFDIHKQCKAVDRETPKDIQCNVIQLLRGVTHDELMETIRSMNKRPLMLEELLVIVEAYPDLIDTTETFALGSFHVHPVYHDHFVPVVRQYFPKGLGLDLFWTVDSFRPAYKVLVANLDMP